MNVILAGLSHYHIFSSKFKITLFLSCEPTQHENSNVYEENTNLWKIPICEAELQSHCTLLFPKSPLLSSLTYSFALIQSWKQRRSLLWEGSWQNAKVSYLQMDINMANKGKSLGKQRISNNFRCNWEDETAWN